MQKPFKTLKMFLYDTYDNIELLHNREGDVTGIPTGFTELDKMTAGFQRNDLIIVGGASIGRENSLCLKYRSKRSDENR